MPPDVKPLGKKRILQMGVGPLHRGTYFVTLLLRRIKRNLLEIPQAKKTIHPAPAVQKYPSI